MRRRAPRSPRPLRRVQIRVVAVTTFALVAVVGVAGYGLVGLFEREMTREVDQRLLTVAGRVAWLGARDVQLPRLGGSDHLVQVVGRDGDVVYGSPTLQDERAMWAPGDGERELLTVRSAAEGRVRIVAVPFRDSWAVLAEPLGPVADAARRLERAMLTGLVPLAVVLAAFVWTAVGRTLRPVAAARDREERLVADVSHELRSPLAGLRVLLETEALAPEETALSRIEALGVLRRLDTITDRLLALTRAGHPPDRGTSRPVDLDEIVLDLARGLAPRSAVRIDVTEVGSGQVVGREHDLAGLVENLLTNALRHARSIVRVRVDEQDGLVLLDVDDDGPGIAPEDRSRVFERFTRLDESRSRREGGSGLGLAIARATVESHDGTIAVTDAPLGGARFAVRIPASTPPPPRVADRVRSPWRHATRRRRSPWSAMSA